MCTARQPAHTRGFGPRVEAVEAGERDLVTAVTYQGAGVWLPPATSGGHCRAWPGQGGELRDGVRILSEWPRLVAHVTRTS